ncbi:PREDICTED: major allergen Pru ar 1-like [Populus euphratica]|uniref:Major allergen Pru ar 1-like n=1 Tax=Populus euphratica TaxID=75702 RepID=A0AAJ6VGD8_POPEU|nr:PREDICTED: major allergen Pru ar 1-like [Populus euphratica]
MEVLTFTEEFSSPVVAKRLFTAMVLEADTLIPKLAPQAVKSIETIEGNGGPGTIKKLTFVEGKYAKHRIDAVDKDKLTHSYTTIEGVTLLDKFESIAYDIKFEATPEGGCKGTLVSRYFPKPGAEIKEEEIKEDKEKAAAVFKAVEAYVVANPQAYA